MALETAVGQKLITEDGLNGLPVRLVDVNGNPLNAGARQRVIYHPSQAETTTWNGPAIDCTPFRFFLAIFNCTVLTGTTPSWQPVLQGSDDGGTTWFNMTAPAAYTTTGYFTATVGPGCTQTWSSGALGGQTVAGFVPDTMRFQVFISGTTPSCTFKASYQGY